MGAKGRRMGERYAGDVSREAPSSSPSSRAAVIAAGLRDAIQQGTYRPGDKLPGEKRSWLSTG
ncbi:hypothetical protein AUCHE_04_00410 [Austwickia chelonae NBRC 105200]|uniref:Uncharacterized protein n=1 Tax=Austwickia chelonae NBRC 105200 TaxID=1184607 RepID=K6VNS7_9MICO|nr:hypothetical protein AUCHE_04_00410 [Austwickia chelonae NBRC 105200]